ncbi:MAG: hypothetical protein FWD16_04055, partial [Clostridia bacterium]|nr:hypothetical protein [Clostridia bacterium]
ETMTKLAPRYFEDITYDFVPSGAYGAVYPFAGYRLPLAESGFPSQPVPIFGMCDMQGKVITDPVFDRCVRVERMQSGAFYVLWQFVTTHNDEKIYRITATNDTGSFVMECEDTIYDVYWLDMNSIVGHWTEDTLPVKYNGQWLEVSIDGETRPMLNEPKKLEATVPFPRDYHDAIRWNRSGIGLTIKIDGRDTYFPQATRCEAIYPGLGAWISNDPRLEPARNWLLVNADGETLSEIICESNPEFYPTAIADRRETGTAWYDITGRALAGFDSVEGQCYMIPIGEMLLTSAGYGQGAGGGLYTRDGAPVIYMPVPTRQTPD